jgi:NAD(P)H-quinone oxidoreductase subunit 5
LTLIAWLAAVAPLAYLIAAMAPQRVLAIRLAAPAAAWLSGGVASLCLAGALIAGGVSTPTLGAAGLGLATRVDALSATLACLVAFIGLVVVTYSRNYLAGDPRQPAFIRQLCLTLGLLQGLVLSGNLGQLVFCWIAASLCVNRLLLFRGDRQAAVLAARKRFIFSRVADAALIIAAAGLWRAAGSGDIAAILEASQGAAGAAWGASAVLLATTAILSAAQIPFHGWILEVMETPTPVSALLHAGVVNAGGFLVLRFGALILDHPAALSLLAMVGALSAVLGSLVMLTQTSVKVTLAYSTIAQMGFMLLECGLGAYSVALLHIVAHALYKAHAFLSAGDAAAGETPAAPRPAAPALVLVPPALVLILALGMTALGAGPAQRPGGFLLASVLLLGLAKVVLGRRRSSLGLAGLAAASALMFAAHLGAQAMFARLLGDLAGHAPAPVNGFVALAIGVVAAMTALVCLQLRLPAISRSPAWTRAYIVVAHGFYLNTLANRWVLRLWPAPPSPSKPSGAIA